MYLTKLSTKLAIVRLCKFGYHQTFTPKILQLFASNRVMGGPRIDFMKGSKKPNDNKKNENNSEDNNDDDKKKDPKGDPKGQSKWWQKLQQKIKALNIFLNEIYVKKYPTKRVILATLAIILFLFPLLTDKKKQIPLSQFINLLQSDMFSEVIFVQDELFYSKKLKQKKIEGVFNQEIYYTNVNNFQIIYELVLKKNGIKYRNQKRYGYQFVMQKLYLIVDSMLLLYMVMIIRDRKKKGMMGQMDGIMKTKKFELTKNVQVKFRDVAGLHEVKREVQEIVDFLKNPEKYHVLGATIPKGVLLTGPPGTGKTMLAKACAGEAGVPFFSVSGSDFVEMYVGVGASRVRQLFQQAKKCGSSAIIFIDQLDAIGKKRMNKFGGNDERESTLNQLLVEMDGFETSNKVIVMAATNRKQILDIALIRPGRFDREVEIGLPDLKGRFEIFQVHLKPLRLSSKYSLDDYARRLASLTPGFSGAEIANLCNEAAILSARHEKQVVEMIDFELSSERVIGGVERKGFVSVSEKKTVAFHQCGHAVVSWFLQGADPLLKVTIIPRSKGALGFAQYFLNENTLQTREQIIDKICFILGGRCAEKYFFNEVTTGAYDDLMKAYQLGYSLVAKHGMDTEIGYISFPDVRYTKPYGERTESAIDRQIHKIIMECTVRTEKMIVQHQNDIKKLAESLLIKQTLDVQAIQKILGQRPFPPNKTFQEYLETSESS